MMPGVATTVKSSTVSITVEQSFPNVAPSASVHGDALRIGIGCKAALVHRDVVPIDA
jgi:hypothetical protein